MKPCVFKSNKLCVFLGYQRSSEEGQWFETVMKEEEDEDMFFQSIREKSNQSFGEVDGIALSRIEEFVMKSNSTSLAFKEGQQRDKKQILKTIEDIQKDEQQLMVFAAKEEIYTLIADTEERNAKGNDQHYD